MKKSKKQWAPTPPALISEARFADTINEIYMSFDATKNVIEGVADSKLVPIVSLKSCLNIWKSEFEELLQFFEGVNLRTLNEKHRHLLEVLPHMHHLTVRALKEVVEVDEEKYADCQHPACINAVKMCIDVCTVYHKILADVDGKNTYRLAKVFAQLAKDMTL
jgi:hypothetical protein